VPIRLSGWYDDLFRIVDPRHFSRSHPGKMR
jgi:hypothetical protein